ncbi:MAG: endonuclease III [Bacteroidales bacterium]|nr:endonuclease III [Bacteroidales bacterium]
MRKDERYRAIVEWFRSNVPVAQSELQFRSPYELIVAVVLSAQCTDRRVNMVTPALFEAYPTPFELAAAPVEEIYGYVKSVSYPNNKARHLKGLGQKLVSDFGGQVPSAVADLMTLPGVGRKTANVVASIIYDEPVIAVDTHVYRVSHRLGLSRGKTPYEVELDLEKHIPEEFRSISHHWLILHGRYTCTARSPRCSDCGFSGLCAYHSRHAKSEEPAG